MIEDQIRYYNEIIKPYKIFISKTPYSISLDTNKYDINYKNTWVLITEPNKSLIYRYKINDFKIDIVVNNLNSNLNKLKTSLTPSQIRDREILLNKLKPFIRERKIDKILK